MELKKEKKKWWGFSSLRTANPVVEATLSTAVPIDIAIEKLRGFVSDHTAQIVSTKDNRVELEITSHDAGANRRRNDRPIPFRIEICFREEREEKTNSLGFASGEYARTYIDLVIRPKHSRNRRRADIAERGRLFLQSIKAYLMASDVNDAKSEETVAQDS